MPFRFSLGLRAKLRDGGRCYDPGGPDGEFKRALQLNPGSSDAHQMYGYYLAGMGRFDEAVREMERAGELDPLSLVKIVGIGEVFHLARRFDEPAAQYRKALGMGTIREVVEVIL